MLKAGHLNVVGAAAVKGPRAAMPNISIQTRKEMLRRLDAFNVSARHWLGQFVALHLLRVENRIAARHNSLITIVFLAAARSLMSVLTP